VAQPVIEIHMKIKGEGLLRMPKKMPAGLRKAMRPVRGSSGKI
jgi:hypothetical protein